MLERVEVKEGTVFDSLNLRKAWAKACCAAGFGSFGSVDEHKNQRYTDLLIHNLRRSAIKFLMKAGVSEKVAMAISGHNARSVFDRYHIVDTEDVVTAMRKVQAAPVKSPFPHGESLVGVRRSPRRLKRLTA